MLYQVEACNREANVKGDSVLGMTAGGFPALEAHRSEAHGQIREASMALLTIGNGFQLRLSA